MAEPQRMRVGLVIGQLTYGGAEGQLCRLAMGLRESCDVVVYCMSGATEPYGAQLRAAGVTLRVFPAFGSFDVTRVVRLARALREDKIAVVHAFLFIASAYAYLATRFPGRACLVTSARNCKHESNPVRRGAPAGTRRPRTRRRRGSRRPAGCRAPPRSRGSRL